MAGCSWQAIVRASQLEPIDIERKGERKGGLKEGTPPFSPGSDKGRSPRPPDQRPNKRSRTDGFGENDRPIAPQPPEFITLHEKCVELEKTAYHFPKLQAFVDKLALACQSKWDTRHVPYKKVIALLTHWGEDDLGVLKEISSLKLMLSDTYNYDVETFAIPSRRRGYTELVDRMKSLFATYDVEGNLFILYYGGHATQDQQSQPTWVSYALPPPCAVAIVN